MSAPSCRRAQVRTFSVKGGTSSSAVIEDPLSTLLVLMPLGKNRPRPSLAPLVRI